MKRIAPHLLLALALVLQGVPGAFGAVMHSGAKPSDLQTSCCPDGMSMPADGDNKASCPDCPNCACSIDCILVCPACTAVFAAPISFTLAPIPISALPPALRDGVRRTHSDSPPTRPPIA